MNTAFRARAFVVVAVLLSWLVLVVMMWQAYHRVPTPEALGDARHVRPPLPVDLYLNMATSLGESLFLTALLWPWWGKRYLGRLVLGTVALVLWFFLSVPMDLNTMEWLHRRWLALMVLFLIVCALVYPLITRHARHAPQS